MSAAAELQTAIFETLSGDAALSALVGTRIFDTVPAQAAFPYITFGRTSRFDWSTGTEDGAEHLFVLNVWSKATGKAELLDIMATVEIALRDGPLTLGGHHLVNLRPELAETRILGNAGIHHGVLRYRAVTEPA